MVLKVDSERVSEIVEEVLQIEFTTNFKEVQFNPSIQLQNIDQTVLNRVFAAQRDFLQNTTSALVPGVNPEVSKVKLRNGSMVLLQELVMGKMIDANQGVKRVAKRRRRPI